MKMGRLTVPAQGIVFHYYRSARTSQLCQLKQIRQLGFDVIHTEESPVARGKYRAGEDTAMAWNYIEIGKQRYDWGFLDQLVEDCTRAGLQLFHDISLTHHLPDWIAEAYPDTEVVYPTGERVGQYIRPDFCHMNYRMRTFSLAHPACREAAADFMGRVAARYAGSPVVVGYILIEELCLNYPHGYTWYGQDVSPAVLQGFVHYLEAKYGTVAGMNAALGAAYGDFATAAADPGRFQYASPCHPLWVDWCYYRSAYTAQFFRAVSDAIKQADAEALILTTAVDPYPSYWIAHGVRLEEFGFCDIVGRQSFGGVQDYFRGMFSWARTGGAQPALSNLNILAPGQDITLPDMVRKWFAALGLGSKWNALYAWTWFTHEHRTTGRRVVHANLRDFVPYLRWIRRHRAFLGGLEPVPAEIALLKPVRSDVIFFWWRHDPRLRRRSHPYGNGSQETNAMADLLNAESIPYDYVAEEHLPERLASGQYKLLVVGEACVPRSLATTIREWVSRGGRLVLLQGAARFDERGNPATFFDDLLSQQHVSALVHRDREGWQEDGAFPWEAVALLVETAHPLQLPDILRWAGIKRLLEFVHEPVVEQPGTHGTCRGVDKANPYLRNIAVYAMRDARGRRVYFLVQKGASSRPMRDIPILWERGVATLHEPPLLRTKKLVPRNGRLVLPRLNNVAVVVENTPRDCDA